MIVLDPHPRQIEEESADREDSQNLLNPADKAVPPSTLPGDRRESRRSPFE